MLIQDISMIYDAFQTLMETCKNLLNHDIQGRRLLTVYKAIHQPERNWHRGHIQVSWVYQLIFLNSIAIHKYKNEKLSPLQFLAPRTFKIYLYHLVPVIEYKLKNNTWSFNCFTQYWGFDLLSGQYSMHFIYHIKRKMYVHMYINVNNSS